MSFFCSPTTHRASWSFSRCLVASCGLPWWVSSKESTCQCRRRKRHRFDPWVRKIPWRRACHPTPVLLPRGSHGQRSLEGCSPQGHRVGHDRSNLACSTWHTRLREREEFSSVHFFVRIICACIMSIVSKLQCFFIFNFCSLWGLSSSVCVCLVAQSCPTLCDPMDCSLPGSSVHGDSPGKNTGVGCHVLLQGILPAWGSNPGLSHCRDSLLSEPPGKPKKTRVGSQSLLQGNFLTQESNWGLRHCSLILYQLS